jgi:OHCU decarboxylase
LGAAEAQATLLRCCGSSSWASQLAVLRPFEDVPALLRQAERVFWQLAPSDWLEAYAAHPRIGDRGGSAWSSKEQQGAAKADPLTLTELSVANQSYVDRFGFIYIVCASGRSGPQMLADLRQRLTHTPEQELRTAAEEQAKITRLRLGKLLQELALSTSEAS